MYVNVAIVRINPGHEANFEERLQNAGDEPMYAAPGFIGNSCLRDDDNPGRYIYTSAWESEAHIKAFRESQDYSKAVKTIDDSGDYAGRPDQFGASLVMRRGKELSWP